MVLAGSLILSSCGGGDDDAGGSDQSDAPGPSGTGTATSATIRPDSDRTLKVPSDYSSVQAAVDDARPGDLVLIDPGTYHEAVIVSTPRVVVRGVDRNAVVLDGQHQLGNGITVVGAGAVVENLTVTGYTFNGVLITGGQGYSDDAAPPEQPLEGYRVSYVTAYNNGLYGIYAFGVRGGQIDHSYASGHPDSGFYVGQCKPCDVLVTDNVAENNYIGYEGTNAGGATFIVNSVWRGNRIGMTINSQNTELLAPQDSAVIAGNLVTGNDNTATPGRPDGSIGVGIAIGGGTNNVVTRNRITGNGQIGVALTDLDGYPPLGNQILDNAVAGHAVADLAVYRTGDATAEASGNCFSGNQPSMTWPLDLETVLPCSGSGEPPAEAAGPSLGQPPDVVDYQTLPAPPPQESMPDATSAPAAPFDPTVPSFDVADATIPA